MIYKGWERTAFIDVLTSYPKKMSIFQIDMLGEWISVHVSNHNNNRKEIHCKMYTRWGKFKLKI